MSVLWAEVQPQLSTRAAHSPQWVNGALITCRLACSISPIADTDVYVPTVMGTDENDIALVFNYSGNTTSGLYPSIGYHWAQGDAMRPARWDRRGASWNKPPLVIARSGRQLARLCRLRHPAQLGDARSVWCAYEYTVSNAWKTRLIALRLE